MLPVPARTSRRRTPRGPATLAIALLAAGTIASTGVTATPSCGPIDLGAGYVHAGWLVADPTDPTAADGSFTATMPQDREPPSGPGELLVVPSTATPAADAPRFTGEVTGTLRSIQVTLHRGIFLDQAPTQRELHVTLVVDGAVLHDGRVAPHVSEGRPDVCHVGHYGAYHFRWSGIDVALAELGLANDAGARHEVAVAFAPTGDGVEAPALELFGVGTQVSPSVLEFNSGRTVGPRVDVSRAGRAPGARRHVAPAAG